MADLVITASEVKAGTGCHVRYRDAGEALTRGEVVYFDGASQTLKKADADSQDSADADGIVLKDVSVGDETPYAVPDGNGTVEIGSSASIAQGEVYCVSTNAGKIAPVGDLATGDWITILGVGDGNNGIKLAFFASGIVHS